METPHLNDNQDVPVINTKPLRRKTIGRWLSLTIAVVVVGAAALFFMYRNNKSNVQAASMPTVTITSGAFEPQTIKVKKGESVTWVNSDTQAHHVIADPYPGGESLLTLNSGEPLAGGESYTTTFEESGTYMYHDQLNPATLKATIVVE